MAVLVNEISITLGVTRSIGQFEFARVDITNRATIDPCEPGSREYRAAHKELLDAAENIFAKVEAQVIPEPDATAKGKG